MSDNVLVRGADSDTATLLLEAAEKKGYDPSVVSLTSTPEGNAFSAPSDVAKEAGLDPIEEKSLEDQVKDDEKRLQSYLDAAQTDQPGDGVSEPEPEPAAKKTAAKKTAKKAAAKKTAKKS